MTNELLAVLEYFEKEKGIDRATMVEALESALLSASRRSVGPARELRIEVDPDKGSIKAIAKLVAVETVEKPFDEIALATAQRIKPDVALGDEVDVEVTPNDFGRIAAQTAKQAMMQRLRQAEKAMIYEEFKDRAGDIVAGTVRRFERSDVIIDLGKFEGVMPARERVTTEEYNIGDRLRAYVVAVENGSRGPEIILSRSHPNFVRRLFEFEVSEIADHTVEMRGIAREAGYRTKVAVWSSDEKVDPVGACVGLRGARVKNIVRELNNEKVDIIRWSDEPKEFVTEALKPAIIRSITLEEDIKKVRVTVDESELSKAIGRRGQNARLTSRLLGWDVQVEKDESAHEAFEARVEDAAAIIADKLSLEHEVALKLVQGGLVSVETIAAVDADDIAEILEVEEDEGRKILAAAVEAVGGGEVAEVPAGDGGSDGDGESGGETGAAEDGDGGEEVASADDSGEVSDEAAPEVGAVVEDEVVEEEAPAKEAEPEADIEVEAAEGGDDGANEEEPEESVASDGGAESEAKPETA
ncbi:MAG: transcription termination factor NusA [Verrucomicrobiota bacterium]